MGLNYNGSKWVEGEPKDPKEPLETAGKLPHYSRMSTDDASTLIRKTLKSGERNFLRRLFGSPDLSDKEVGKMVGTQDLEAYVASIEKEILTTQKASFEEIWFTSSDVQFHNHVGQEDKGSIWGFRMQNDMYAGTDLDPKTVQGLEGGAPSVTAHSGTTPAADVDSSFAVLNARITPEAAAKIDTTFSFEIGDGTTWFADFRKSEGPWIEKKSGDASSSFKVSKPEKWIEIVAGDLNPTAAFMSGLLVVDGDMKVAGLLS